ncbi:MAG: carboxyl transferase domain-containing protein [Oceanicaulis sp.]
MPKLASRLNTGSDDYRRAVDAMGEKLGQVRALEDKVRANSAAKKQRFEERGQILPRERVARLLDRDQPFLEIAPLAGLKMHDDDGDRGASGGGMVTGIGVVAGKRCVVSASDSAIKGGTIAPMGLKKSLRAQEIAFTNKLPMIHLVESGGANLLYQAEIFVDGGRSFANQARMSAAGLPQIAVVHGSSTAGGAYLPGLSDYVVLVREKSKIFLAGPPLVKAAIGEDADDESLGGADLHGEVTGLGEYVADDDKQALAYAREIMDKLNWDAVAAPYDGAGPAFPVEELMGAVPADDKTPYDVREVIARITDASDFLEFKARYAPETVCGHARIGGHLVGVIGNNGPIQPEGSTKAGQFIQLCDQSNTPLIFLQNTTGYMVGTKAERDGAIKHGSKMIQAVANARVAKITIVLGGSYGAGNYGMCGRAFGPRFLFMWPNARISVMGGEQAASVLATVKRDGMELRGEEWSEDDEAAFKAPIREKYEEEGSPYYSTARIWDDGVIAPEDTRRTLALALSAALNAPIEDTKFGVFRM